MCWVGGDEENGAAHFGELDGEGAGGGGLSDSSLAANEDPAEGTLVQNGLEGWLEDVLVCVDDCVRHAAVVFVVLYVLRERRMESR